MRKNTLGYTLMEIMIVIAIIGILSSTLFPMVATTYFDRAKRTSTFTEMTNIKRAFQQGQISQGRSLFGITGNACTGCDCRVSMGHSISDSSCLATWNSSRNKFVNYISSSDVAKFEKDDWGYPYVLDENEDEPPSPQCDTFLSYGITKSYNGGQVPYSRFLEPEHITCDMVTGANAWNMGDY